MASKSRPDVGDQAPNFKLPRDGGGETTLADYHGSALAVYFYPKDDTSGCTKEAIDFNGLKNKFEKTGTKILGVSPDSAKSHDKFKAKHKLEIALASDEARKMVEDYGVWVEKSLYGRKYMGVERTTFLIDAAGRIAHVWRKVKVPGHAAAVLDAALSLKKA